MLAVRRTDPVCRSRVRSTATALRTSRAVDSERGPVRVDASRVARIDAAGLTALAVARSRCRADGRTFSLTRFAPEALRGLRVRDDVLTLFGPREARPRGVRVRRPGAN
jgi:ABC-type transporter Mla MlaB component